MSETLQRWKLGHAWNSVGQMDATPDGDYVLADEAQRRIEELEGVLQKARCANVVLSYEPEKWRQENYGEVVKLIDAALRR